MSSILFGDTMVPDIEFLLLGYSILYKEYNLTRFNHQKKRYSNGSCKIHVRVIMLLASPTFLKTLPEQINIPIVLCCNVL